MYKTLCRGVMLRTLSPCWITLRKTSVVRGHVASTLQVALLVSDSRVDTLKQCINLVSSWFLLPLMFASTPPFPQLSRSYSPRPEEVKAPKKQYKVALRDGLTVKTLATKLNVGTGTLHILISYTCFSYT